MGSGTGGEELAILITIDAVDRAQAALGQVNKELAQLDASTGALAAGAGGAKGDLEDLGAASSQAFEDTSLGAEAATGEVVAFGDAVVASSALAQTGMADAAIAAQGLGDTAEEMGTSAETTAEKVSGLGNEVTDAADAATVAEVNNSELSGTTAELGGSYDTAATSASGMGEEVAAAGGVAASSGAEHSALADGLKKASSAMKGLSANSVLLGKTGKPMVDDFVGGLTKLGKWGPLAAAGGAVVALKMAGDFSMAGNRLVTTAGQSEAGLKKVQSGVLDMSTQVGQSAKNLEQGLYLVESAGFHGAKGLHVLRASAQGATEEQATMALVATAVTSALKAYHLPASQAVSVTNQLLTATGRGKMTFQDLAGSLNTVLPTAQALHVSLAQVTGSIATMTAQGKSAQTAAQDVKSFMTSIAKPSTAQVNIMQQLGLTPVSLQKQLQKTGIVSTIGSIQQGVLNNMVQSGTQAGMVMLTSFKKSHLAAQDAMTMYDKMPAKLHRIAGAYAQNKITTRQWSQEIGTLGQKTQQMAEQFATTLQSAQGFNDVIKSGGPGVQTYVGIIDQLMGTTTAATTVLQLTGSHAVTFANNVNAISGAASGAGKHVQGWSHTQHQFNVEMKNLEGTFNRFMITVGEKLIPMLPKAENGFNKLLNEAKKSKILHDVGHDFAMIGDDLKPVAHMLGKVAEFFAKNKEAASILAKVLAGVAVASVALYINKLLHLSSILGGVYKMTSGLAKGGFNLGKWGLGKITGAGGGGAGTQAEEERTAGQVFADQVEEAGTTFSSSIEEAGTSFAETVGAAADQVAGALETGGATAETSMETGGAAAETSIGTGGATAEGSLEAGGATAEADLAAGAGEASTEMGAGGTEASAEMAAGAAEASTEIAAGGADAAVEMEAGGTKLPLAGALAGIALPAAAGYIIARYNATYKNKRHLPGGTSHTMTSIYQGLNDIGITTGTTPEGVASPGQRQQYTAHVGRHTGLGAFRNDIEAAQIYARRGYAVHFAGTQRRMGHLAAKLTPKLAQVFATLQHGASAGPKTTPSGKHTAQNTSEANKHLSTATKGIHSITARFANVLQVIEKIAAAQRANAAGHPTNVSHIPKSTMHQLTASWKHQIKALPKHVPKAAAGAMVTGPTLLVAGEAGTEYIIPQSYLGGTTPGGGHVAPLPSGVAQMASSHSTVYQIQNLVITAQNPAQLEQQLAQKTRVSAMSARPAGSTNMGVGT